MRVSKTAFLLCCLMAISWVALAASSPQWWRLVATVLFLVLAVVTGFLRFRRD